MRRTFPALLSSLLLLGARDPVPRADANDNRAPAGRLRDGVLTIALDAREAMWHPDGPDAPGIAMQAFGERGRTPSIPGPLLRVPAGTEVRASVRNDVPGTTLLVFGLQSRTAEGADREDTLSVPAGETREVRFRLDVPGTYFYWGTTTGSELRRRHRHDSQLTGAIVVDAPGVRRPRDRVFVIGQFVDSVEPGGAPVEGTMALLAINGRSWPATERLSYSVGDSIRWRWINPTVAQHPMHLHGFYFRIERRGDIRRDTSLAPEARPLAVTERMAWGSTMQIVWSPDRPGNWLFHCHVPGHVSAHRPLGEPAVVRPASHATHGAEHDMGGLVLGIHVSGPRPQLGTRPRRSLRLEAIVDSGDAGARERAFGFVLSGDRVTTSRRPLAVPGPVLVLTRNEPVSISIVNRIPATTAVHWHGIELDSFFDGVPGFSGMSGQTTPAIAPSDSFDARFTPPRAGTFIYHTHVDERVQQPAGLSGIIVVLEPGERFDPARDHPILISTPRLLKDRRGRLLVNGSLAPAPLEWGAGERHRLRFVNMATAPPAGAGISLLRDSTVMRWRPVAKDGAALPAALSTERRAVQRVTVGETYDFDVTLDQPGDYRIEVLSGVVQIAPPTVLQIRVR